MSAAMPESFDTILSERRDGVGWLVINRPERRNAVSLAMWDAIAGAVSAFEAAAAVRVVVIRGAGGKAFSAGADISEFERVRADARAEEDYGRRTAAAMAALGGLSKPLIAMIDGDCIGGGLAIALQADIRLASEPSRLGIPAARLGVAYGFGSLTRLTALCGPAVAKEILFTGRFYTAAEALGMRLVNEVAPREVLPERADALAATLAKNAPLSMRASKIAIDQIAGHRDRDAAAVEAAAKACFDSADYREGRRAFMEKRPPRFTGS